MFRLHRRSAKLRILEIEDLKFVTYVSVSRPFVKQLIGKIYRKYLDPMFSWNAADLMHKLDEFKDYSNAHYLHRSLDGATPARRAGGAPSVLAKFDHCAWHGHCRGLFLMPVAA